MSIPWKSKTKHSATLSYKKLIKKIECVHSGVNAKIDLRRKAI